MNILPKKRWHVRTKENIARVRRDEAEALEKEKEAQRRILLAEQEARTNLLREKARSKINDEIAAPQVNRHLNFFEDIEQSGGYKGGTNKEHQAEKKQEQEKYEKSIGLLNYLGQGSSESTGETPWYLKSHESRLEDEDKKIEKEKNKSARKDFLDPMNDMKKYLKMTFGKDEPKKSSSNDTDKSNSKNYKRKRYNSEDKDDCSNKKSSLAKLREERLIREKEERERERQLLARLSGKGETSQPKAIAVDERRNRYNSQFNPHLARQNQPKE